MCSVEISRNYDLLNNIMRRFNNDSNNNNSHNRDFVPIRPDGVRRVLFGSPLDHDATARDLDRHLEEIEVEARARWNFDFGSGNPLRGRYQWQPVSGPPPVTCPGTTVRRPSPSGSPAVTVGQSAREPLEECVKCEPVAEVSPAPRKATVQTKMTDFGTQRKRPSSLPLKPYSRPRSTIQKSSTSPSHAMSSSKLRTTAGGEDCSSSAACTRPSSVESPSPPT